MTANGPTCSQWRETPKPSGHKTVGLGVSTVTQHEQLGNVVRCVGRLRLRFEISVRPISTGPVTSSNAANLARRQSATLEEERRQFTASVRAQSRSILRRIGLV
jgi:hypothetical protein